MSSGQRTASIVIAGIFFLIVFGGLTVAALSSAELNFATVLIAAVSLFVMFAVISALVGAVRRPPDE
jgi:hypothetical protein